MDKTKNSEWNKRLSNIMPWGSSTCSKAPNYLPEEPAVNVKGKGCRVWDADGREFIDYRNACGPVSLGYGYPAVDNAIIEQLGSGIIFSYPHPLECEVAEMLCKAIPCAEQARFLKTGGEAAAACIKLARHYTKRDHIIQIGYNGWLNSLAPGSKVLPGKVSVSAPNGVPLPVSMLFHACGWGDEETLEKLFSEYEGKIAAVIVSADYAGMAQGKTFYPKLRKITKENGSLLIFDEIVTGFRLALGGVQEYFGVTPDLAAFSKAIANGMPLAAYAGSREVMSKLEKGEATVSSTFGGETLSLAAAKVTIDTYMTQDVIGHIWRLSEKLGKGIEDLFVKYGLQLKLKGLWPMMEYTALPGAPDDLIGRFFRAVHSKGVILHVVNFVNFSHRDGDIDETLERIEAACREMR